ncbi:MAG: tripartite tricarboxylate transporter permease [Bauldia sp.]|nr:tripartite tricarboxylate transporter permease [Bauldia sp.]MCW5716745.1 tripartite tricarboxylate transporter permease [Bauldia sp.]
MTELLGNLADGFAVAGTLTNILYAFLGVLLGTVIGVLPGVGPMATIAILMPMTLGSDPTTSLIMLAGVYYGAQYGGSTSAILINVPGEVSSAVTAIEGYQMARRGRAGTALAAAAIGSFVAGTIATIAVALLSPPLAAMARNFASPEYFALMVLGLVMAIALANGAPLKALAMIVLGLLIGMVGQETQTGRMRFTMGFNELADGSALFLPLVIGFFGLAEIYRNLEGTGTREALLKRVSNIWPSRADLRRMVAPILRGTGLGSMFGILPGNGPVLASFASYSIEKRITKHPEEFGHGAIEGVAGPEAANNAGAQTSFVPMLTLGIPPSPVMALMMGAMILNGIIPGPRVIEENPGLFWGLIASMWIGNIMLVILNLPLIGLWVRLLTIPYRVLVPAIVAFSCVGVYAVSSNPFHVFALTLFGLVGYLLVRLRCEPAPLLLGFVLAGPLESNLIRSLRVSRGDPMVFLERPISAGLLAVALVALIVVLLPFVAKKREKVFQEEEG